MANNGNAITAPISDSDINSVIGVGSHDIGYQIYKAKTGGSGGWAFKIVENGHSSGDGELIEGARPYWNIWSNNSPGEWISPSYVDGPLRFRLKRFLGNASLGYGANMHEFDGYIHSSSEPIVGGGEYHFTQGSGSGMLTRTFTFKPRLGSYDWKKVSGATMYRAVVSGPNIGTVYGTPATITSEAQSINITLTINTNNAGTYTYNLAIYIGSGSTNNFDSIGYIPITETMKIIIDPKPIITGSVAVWQGSRWSYNMFSMTDGVTSGNGQTTFSGTYRRNSGDTDGKVLNKITYSWGSAAQGNQGSIDVTSFNWKEGPSYLRSYPVGDNVEAFTSDSSRVANGFSNNHSVTFYYK